MATCRTTYHGPREGWGPVSALREFDLTPCFEEGIILSTLLVVLLVVSLFRLWETKSVTVNRALTRRSASVLKAKLVCSCVMLLVPTANVFSQLPPSLRKSVPGPDAHRSCSEPLFPLVWQSSPTSFSVTSAFRSFSLISSNHSPCFQQPSSLTPTTNKPEHPLQPFYSSGPHTPSPFSFGDALSSPPIPRTSVMSSLCSPSDRPSWCSGSFHSPSSCSRPSSDQTSAGRSTRRT